MDTRRLILFFVFFFSLAMLWDAWQKYNSPRDVTPTASSPSSSSVPVIPAPTPTVDAPVPSAPAGSVPVSAPMPVTATAKDEIVELRTDLFTVQVSVHGGDLIGLELANYKATEDNSRNFKLFDVQHQYAAQSGFTIGDDLPNHKTLFSPLPGKRELSSGEESIQLKLAAPETNGVKVTKVYTFRRNSYLIDVAYEIDNGSQKEIAAYAYYQLQRDTQTPKGESSMVSTFTGPAEYTEQGKFQKIDFKDIEKGNTKFEQKADNGWMAMIQHYFVAAWIPREKLQRGFYTRFYGGAHPVVAAGLIVPLPAIAPGARLDYAASLYAGPQIQSTLNQLAKPVEEGGIGAQGLALVVDYGWLTIVAAPIFWLLEVIHTFIGNWGWSIVILTIIIKAVFFPLSAASYRSMARMRALSPRLKALKERCGDDKQKLNMEMMNLYKTEKINPLGGCLPIAIQIPVFIALYWALLGAVEMRNAPWMLWIQDLSSQDPYYVLPVVMMATMLIQTKLNPTPPDPMQAKIAMIMPFAFGIMFFFFPAGLVLYWVVNNVLSIAQQWQITRMIERGGKAANDARA
jgi:YidC/Oxa1 family membrane protein insertase